MKIEKTSLLKIPFDYVFSIYLIFAVAIILRYLWQIISAFRSTPTGPSAGSNQ